MQKAFWQSCWPEAQILAQDPVQLERPVWDHVTDWLSSGSEAMRKSFGMIAEGLQKMNKKDLASTYVLRLRIT